MKRKRAFEIAMIGVLLITGCGNEPPGESTQVLEERSESYTETIDIDTVKELLTDLNAITYDGSKVYLTHDNITEIHIKNILNNSDGTKNVESTFDVNTEYMVYHNDACLTVDKGADGYEVTGAVINSYEGELTPRFDFNVPDDELIRLLSDKAIKAGNQKVKLEDVDEIISREESFNEEDLTMTIVAKVGMEKEAYDATADIYYTYRISDDGKRWEMDSFHGTGFRVSKWKDIKGVYTGIIDDEEVTVNLIDQKENEINVVLTSEDDKNMETELYGTIDDEDLSIILVNMDTEKEYIKGDFSDDLKTFKGSYVVKG